MLTIILAVLLFSRAHLDATQKLSEDKRREVYALTVDFLASLQARYGLTKNEHYAILDEGNRLRWPKRPAKPMPPQLPPQSASDSAPVANVKLETDKSPVQPPISTASNAGQRAAAWRLVKEFKGKAAVQTTDDFEIGSSKWRVLWTTSGDANFLINVCRAEKGPDPIANVTGDGSGTSLLRGPGKFCLKIDARQSYEIKVEESTEPDSGKVQNPQAETPKATQFVPSREPRQPAHSNPVTKPIGETRPAEASKPQQREIETAAVVPWIFQQGTKGAVTTSKEVLASVIAKAGIDVISEGRTAAVWTQEIGTGLGSDKRELPSAKELLAVGEKLGVKWMIAGKSRWHTKSIWISLGPKTKSDCTVDVLIVDVPNKEISLKAEGVNVDSTAKEDTLKALGTVFLTPLFTVVSGGPKTPHEQRAGGLAIAKAMQPWLAARIGSKIEPEKKIR